jgi:hypothetical protein
LDTTLGSKKIGVLGSTARIASAPLVVERRQLLTVEERVAEQGRQERRYARRWFVHELESSHVGVAVEGIGYVLQHLAVIVLQTNSVRGVGVRPE